MWQRQWQIRIWSRCFAFSCVLFSSSSHHHGTLDKSYQTFKTLEWKGTPAGPHRPLPVKLRQKRCSRCVRSSQIHPTEIPTNTPNWSLSGRDSYQIPFNPSWLCCAQWTLREGDGVGSDKGRSNHLLSLNVTFSQSCVNLDTPSEIHVVFTVQSQVNLINSIYLLLHLLGNAI